MKDVYGLIPAYHPNNDYGVICGDYMVCCDEYPGIYQFMSFLKNLIGCDYSDAPQDWFRMRNGMIQSHWVIFVSCLPKDMLRLRHVANHMKYDIEIIDDDDLDDLIPFV